MATVTQRKLAEIVGVSYPTVNRILNGNKNVRHGLRKKVLEAADLLGYRKNLAARSLSTQRSYAVGIILTNSPHSYWSDVLSSLEGNMRMKEYQVVVCHTKETISSDSSRELEFMLSQGVDGIIIAANPPFEKENSFLKVAATGTPLLLLNNFLPGVPASYLGKIGRAHV